ncbi:hypothetical protein [Aeromonas phage JELG-KS1]|uniref:Uncharacterized protein n=1 Tax=Aeromonas phage JELG-KS1 TaxID=2951233 RepID=A0A9E7NLP9_9CAUD|nr:hypothetical protein [Aeromonas phage JELG-KS1]
MASQPRLCINCKHYEKGRTFSCRRAVNVTYERSIISGKLHKYESGGEAARDERKWNGPNYCGPDAKFYAEKRLTHRLIAKFKQ